MREIKFRWWNGVQMIEHKNISLGVKNIKGNHGLMEFTGLKDKNGVEIYEKDIVKYLGQTIVIEIKEKTFVNYGHGDSTHNHCVGYILGFYGNKFEPNHLLKIGNVYENPELINEPKTD